MNSSRSRLLAFFLILLVGGILLAALFSLDFIEQIPSRAEVVYGPPTASLSDRQRLILSWRLLNNQERMLNPANPSLGEISFVIEIGESTDSIINHLVLNKLISSADLFRDYLVYSGLDTRLQAGEFLLNGQMTMVEIAAALQDSTPRTVDFTVLAGWRMEEIAESLPTSGLAVTPAEFLAAANQRYSSPKFLSRVPEGYGLEGMFAPGTWELNRDISATDLVLFLTTQTENAITQEILNGLEQQGLNLYQGLILASIIEREAVVVDEMPVIASVFINRLEISMKLETDPTVQYALGYNPVQQTWWTNPLSYSDLEVDSPFNTYLYPGLPPTPIASPSLAALQAAAFPAKTPYYYFRAACDGSGLHNFSETYQQHLEYACP
ncbi:MAG: endolytic transglycosylase MltG [Anaerolineales bacterium]|nr:endolytic transglycosylase MltG [Anaerolineales bacterium]